jgi:cytoskeletal protein CcmA (bactofilin family)
MAMWKQQSSAPAGSWPEQSNTSAPAFEPPAPAPDARFTPPQPRVEQSVFTNGITVRGEISGPEAIYIDGTIEGEINIPGERVTVGPNGIVSGSSKTPCITAREIVVLGAVRGNMVATDRLEIRANGSVMGDVSTARLKIEDGSYFQGAIEIREPELQPELRHPEDEFELSSSRRDYAEAVV